MVTKMRWKYTSLLLSSLLLFSGVSGCSLDFSASQKKVGQVESIDKSSIEYVVKGKGDTTIVFVHCWTCNRTFWDAQVNYFAQKYQVISLDLAGHGKSTSNRENYTISAFGQDVVSVIEDVGAKQVILVGHSMGGPVAIEAAKILENKTSTNNSPVIGIVGVDTFYTSFQYPKTTEEIANFTKSFENNFQKTSDNLIRSMFTKEADPKLVDSIANTMTNAEPKMAVSAISQILAWKAEKETADLQKFSNRLRNINAAPTGQEKPLHESVVLVKNVGHFLPQVKPEEFNQILDSVIADLSRKPIAKRVKVADRIND